MPIDEYILGPPGTGKTTTLVNRITEALEDGMAPDRIGLITFTKGAAEVAVRRVQEAFPTAKFPYIRTLHSLAFSELGIKKAQVISDYGEIAESIHLKMRKNTLQPPQEGDLAFQVSHLSRTLGVPLEAAYKRCQYDVSYERVLQAETALADYKRQTGKVDFVDMLLMLRDEHAIPPLDLLLIDEAQDLSRVQWDIVDLFKCHKILAGDDDQTIYSWAGADVAEYIRRIETGTQTILSKSYRLPREIWTEANALIGKVSLRYPKKWAPRDEDGRYVNVPPDHKPSYSEEGRYLILALFQYQLMPIGHDLRKRGLWYEYPDGTTSIPPSITRAHCLWEDWRVHNNRAPGLAAACRPHMTQFASHKYLSDGARPEVSFMSVVGDSIKRVDRHYYSRALVSTQPKIRLSTVHRAKGGEAEHVMLMNPSAKRTRDLYRGDRDDLIRLLYVGMTRAIKSLAVTRGGELI